MYSFDKDLWHVRKPSQDQEEENEDNNRRKARRNNQIRRT